MAEYFYIFFSTLAVSSLAFGFVAASIVAPYREHDEKLPPKVWLTSFATMAGAGLPILLVFLFNPAADGEPIAIALPLVIIAATVSPFALLPKRKLLGPWSISAIFTLASALFVFSMTNGLMKFVEVRRSLYAECNRLPGFSVAVARDCRDYVDIHWSMPQ